MHSRNPYAQPIDFVTLSVSYPPLKKHLVNGTIDFKNDMALRCLTEAILSRDFGIQIYLPNDRLCPPVPNRLNYILWLQDIILACSASSHYSEIRAIDIGTGASAIYPLLACKLELTWSFVATDIDQKSLSIAQQNVASNNLQDRIKIVQSTSDGPILSPLTRDANASFTFSMCNPPFYSSVEEVARSAEDKILVPNAVCTGAAVEMVTPGGESTFVRKMIQESLEHKMRCRWYTSMLGKLSSVSEVVGHLREAAIDNYAITEFIQGQTRRWAVGWSFTDDRLPDSIARISTPSLHSYLPPRNTLRQSLQINNHIQDLGVILDNILSSIEEVEVHQQGEQHAMDISDDNPPSRMYSLRFTHDSWSRSARRKRKNMMQSDVDLQKIMICNVELSIESFTQAVLGYQWIYGHDRALFESICSHISRKVTVALSVPQ